MSDIEAVGKRSRGRPPTRTDDETRHLIAEAARHEFMAHGYAGASIDNVAKAAGVSKKTLYRLIPAKADLFKASVTDRIALFKLAVDEETSGRNFAERAGAAADRIWQSDFVGGDDRHPETGDRRIRPLSRTGGELLRRRDRGHPRGYRSLSFTPMRARIDRPRRPRRRRGHAARHDGDGAAARNDDRARRSPDCSRDRRTRADLCRFVSARLSEEPRRGEGRRRPSGLPEKANPPAGAPERSLAASGGGVRRLQTGCAIDREV